MAGYGTRRRDDKQLQPRCYVFPALASDGSGGVSVALVAATRPGPTAHIMWSCCVKTSKFDNAVKRELAATLSKATQSDGLGQQFYSATRDSTLVMVLLLVLAVVFPER
jgi:hypothetical protein